MLYAGTGGSGVFSIQQVAAKVVGTGTAASCTDAALNAALAGGGLVTFDCGGAATIDISTGTGTKTIAADTTIDGGGLVTLSGGDSVGVFRVTAHVHFTVKDLKIANGFDVSGFESGGCGGGIYNGNGSVTVTHATFLHNGAQGVVSETGSSVGGAICNSLGTLNVTNSTFTGNNLVDRGGAIANSGEATVTNSTFARNGSRGGGGAIVNASFQRLTVANSTFTGNSGGLGGGGIENYGTLTVTASNFTSNSGDAGGGILNVSGLTVLRNTIVANNAGGNCFADSGSITDGGYNLDDGTSCGFSAVNGSLSDTDPQLDPTGLQNNGGPTQTVALCTAVGVPVGCAAASPAIDAGDQAVCAAAPVNDLDQRGFVRPGTGHTQCSIGAYEADATVLEACTGDCSGTSSVAINDLITLVNIDLGSAQPSACPHGIPSGANVDISLIIQAVNNTLNGCGSGQ